MIPALTCLALTLVGVDLGYRPSSDGGIEFILQIDPATLQSYQPGRPFEFYVERKLQAYRPTRLTVTLGNEELPHDLPPMPAAPAKAPEVQATRMMPVVAEEPAPVLSSGTGDTVRMPPPAALLDPPKASPSEPSPSPTLPMAPEPQQPAPVVEPQAPAMPTEPATHPASPGESRIDDLAPVAGGTAGSSQGSSVAWLGMCLLVIALMASNVYVGWLFVDARQRYLGLLARTFSLTHRGGEGHASAADGIA